MSDGSQQTRLGYVLESSPSSICIELDSDSILLEHKEDLQIGKFLLVACGHITQLVCTIQSIKATHRIIGEGNLELKFVVNAKPVGVYSRADGFARGSKRFPVPTEPAYKMDADILSAIYASSGTANFRVGRLSQNPDVDLTADGDKLFSKHIAIVGSTGSGKSCTVARIIQDVVGVSHGKNKYKNEQRNSHVVIFDIHSEYKATFELEGTENFTLNNLDVSNLALPYWMMNSDELETLFIESSENGSYNQVSQFRHAVIRNKEIHNPGVKDVAFDTPIYFSIEEVCHYIDNMNNEVIGKAKGQNLPKLHDDTLVEDRNKYFSGKLEFAQTSRSDATKASPGPYNGDFDRLHMRLVNKIADKRLKFIFDAKTSSGAYPKTDDFSDIIKQFIGYTNKSNVTILDLSGVPHEVLDIVVSLVSRLMFEFCFNYSKIKHASGALNDVPVMLVCEEAHNYVPRVGKSSHAASRQSIERIAKEGRKYGITLMVVSQRPSEVSETIFSQCSNFISLRLTNQNDQNYIKSLLPDMADGVGEILPNLAQGEFLIVGDAVLIPSVGVADRPNPEPHSQSIPYLSEWKKLWMDVDFQGVVKRWRKE
ncbi:ATP-binding protein [Azospirillum griseum]|uniref:DUF87 domain-containing protein n=1 Tax=Azospirillum griseum TaxID=2496639 RepID=A0A431VKR3_9PROT|nr:DUF87 domain-containing protein [Azospirillum griseum]RTR23047.1 DUF87 domain-containing protein [Azospirillum griseum]